MANEYEFVSVKQINFCIINCIGLSVKTVLHSTLYFLYKDYKDKMKRADEQKL